MDNDFLDGIDEHFERLMKLYGNTKRNGGPLSRSRGDRLVWAIIEHLQDLSKEKKEEVLSFIQSLKQDVK